MKTVEANFDGMAGPTHNYAGLSKGNLASAKNAKMVSNPQAAAKQGLAKMKALHDMGLVQGFMPPRARPDIRILRQLGFSGSDSNIIRAAATSLPEIFHACVSSSAMWAANAATVSPGADTRDGRVHFTPANLSRMFHRSLEAKTTSQLLKAMFPDTRYFAHHDPLPAHDLFSDEGAANHTRLCADYGKAGIELFVYGKEHNHSKNNNSPKKFVARQARLASECIARLHGLNENRVIFARQNPEVIDQGVFHNDVIATGNRNVFLYHELAFAHKETVLDEISKRMRNHPLHLIEVKEKDISVDTAVSTYLFNTQLVTLNDNSMAIIAPEECRQNTRVANYLEELVSKENPVNTVKYLDVRQSMKNGGGPACLRLRVALDPEQLNAVNPGVIMSQALFEQLEQWIERHYRDRLDIDDLHDPQLLVESQTALDELTQICRLGPVYPFQQT